MIINRFGGGGSGTIPVGDIATTHRTITDANYQLCNGSIIANPSNDMIDVALTRNEFAKGPAPTSTGSSLSKDSGPFYDGTYLLRPGTNSNGYPVVEVWTRGNNGIFIKNGLKTIMSVKVSTPMDYPDQTSAITKCGGYYYYAFATTDLKVYIAYTTNPTGTWSTREVDLTVTGITLQSQYFMARTYTNDSKVRLLVCSRDKDNSSLYYFMFYEFSGDVSNITYISTQNFSIAGSYGSMSSIPSNGIKRIGNYYVIGGFSDNFVYATFTSNWTILSIRGSSYYGLDGVGFDGTYYYRGFKDSDSLILGKGTSVPAFYQSGSLSIHVPFPEDFALSSFGMVYRGTNTNSNGPMIFKYKNVPYVTVSGYEGSSVYKMGIFQLDATNNNLTRVGLIADSVGFGDIIPDPTRPFQFVSVESYTPYLVGPAVPDLTGLNRNSYMRIG